MNIKRDLDTKLIRLVKEFQVLYDPKDPEHSDYVARELAWQKIGDTLGKAPQSCKARWVNIRDVARKRFRKGKLIQKGSKFYNELEFMIPFFMAKGFRNNEEFETEYLDDSIPHVSQANYEERDHYQKDVKPVCVVPEDLLVKDFHTSATDPIDAFLMSVGTTLRKFSPYYQNQAKSSIFQIVQDYELKQIMNKDNAVDPIAESCDSNS